MVREFSGKPAAKMTAQEIAERVQHSQAQPVGTTATAAS